MWQYRQVQKHLEIPSCTVDLDAITWAEWRPLLGDLTENFSFVQGLWDLVGIFYCRNQPKIMQTSRMERSATTVQDRMAKGLVPRGPSYPPHGCALHTGRPDELAHLGSMVWPRPVADVLRDFPPGGIEPLLGELRWRLVDWVAVNVTGKMACQIAIPLLNPCWPHKEIGDAKFQLRALAVLIFAVYRQQHYGDQARSYRLMPQGPDPGGRGTHMVDSETQLGPGGPGARGRGHRRAQG